MEVLNEKSIIDLKTINNCVKDYIESLSAIEMKALSVAIRELESSFSIEESIGFLNFKKNTIQHHKT